MAIKLVDKNEVLIRHLNITWVLLMLAIKLLKPRWHLPVSAGDVCYIFPANPRSLSPVYFLESAEFLSSSLNIMGRWIVQTQL